MESIFFSRHLDEIDDLAMYGRDAPLASSSENQIKLEQITNMLYAKIAYSNKKAILFVTSPRVRAQQTAQLVAGKLLSKCNGTLSVRFSINENLKATEQGTFILPQGYQRNTIFEGLKMANEVFIKETHGSDVQGGKDNIDYSFGDPVMMVCGSYRYPELAKYFSSYGDTYRQSLLRIYSSILDMESKYSKFRSSVELAIIAHGQTFHIIRGLIRIAQLVSCREIDYRIGDSCKLLWKIYKACGDDKKITGVCEFLDCSFLGNHQLMQLLREEVNYLHCS